MAAPHPHTPNTAQTLQQHCNTATHGNNTATHCNITATHVSWLPLIYTMQHSATTLQQHCNSTATRNNTATILQHYSSCSPLSTQCNTLQQHCNNTATTLQQLCNNTATTLQHLCNIYLAAAPYPHIATHCSNTATTLRQNCNNSATTLLQHCCNNTETHSTYTATQPHMSSGSPLSTHCNTLQHTATHYNTLQHTATTLQLATTMQQYCHIHLAAAPCQHASSSSFPSPPLCQLHLSETK